MIDVAIMMRQVLEIDMYPCMVVDVWFIYVGCACLFWVPQAVL